MSVHSGEQLDALLDQISVLRGPRTLEELPGGLTNRNVKVTVGARSYVARFSDATNNMLAIDREAEFVNSTAAERSGVGAPVIDFRPDLGILVVAFIDGATLTNADFQRPGMIGRAAAGVRQLHSGPRFRGRFDMFERQADYLNICRTNGFRLPDGYLDHAATFLGIRRVLERTVAETVPCNNDLLAGNFIDDGDKIWLIDYEYSGNNDPCFELGNIAGECGLSDEQLAGLVTAYYGKPLRHKIARARLQMSVARYGWTLWGCIQSASSTIDYDFWAWGIERYEAAVADFTGTTLTGLLADVQRTD